MRFALLGNDPDGLALAGALVDSGRHQLAAYTAPVAEEVRKGWNADARQVADGEEVLADPAVTVVIAAGSPASRPVQLRRALQAERHVLCVRPGELPLDAAYEAALLQGDTGCVLVPLLPAALHPGVRRLAAFVSRTEVAGPEAAAVGPFVLLSVEAEAAGEVLLGLDAEAKPAFPGWEVLRALGGEIEEVSAFAEREEVGPGDAVLLAGRFAQGGLLHMTLLPRRPSPSLRLSVVGTRGRAELYFPLGWEGPAFLSWQDGGERREESWEYWDPWPALAEVFEKALAGLPPESEHVPQQLREAIATAPAAPRAARRPPPGTGGPLTWQDAVRCLELDDAARRSISRRRASALEYPQASEEASFKGTMTLVGCGLVWAMLLLVIVSAWVPWAKYVIFPLLVVFLALQLLRYVIPSRPGPETTEGRTPPAGPSG
jgi:predicted dehydrogenase